MIDSNEDVVNQYRYSPFGEKLLKNEQVYNPYQYTGRRYDEESGLYYYRARMYSPEMSRFTSNDPAQESANLYAYVGNDPVNRRDPSGKMLINPYLNILFYGNRYTRPAYGGVGGLMMYPGHAGIDWTPKYVRKFVSPSEEDVSRGLHLNNKKYAECLRDNILDEAARAAIGCIVTAMSVAIILTIVGIDIVTFATTSPTGAGAVAATATVNVAALAVVLIGCNIGGSLLASVAGDIITCGLTSLEYS